MITKEELRNKMFKQMCDCAENIEHYYVWGESCTNIHFVDRMVPEAFKPGVADKFLFRRILEEVIDITYQDLVNEELEMSIIGHNVMAKCYYPQYGVWKKMPRE